MDKAATRTLEHRKFSVKLWPPNQSTRAMLVERMAVNLSTPSVLFRKYGVLSKEEAKRDAAEIEKQVFSIANRHYETEPDGDGSSAVQLYARESSKLMLEVLKRGPTGKNKEEARLPEDHAPLGTVLNISAGERSDIKAEEVELLLKPLTQPGNAYTRICFSNRSFGLDAARVAEPILSSVKGQLTELDLSDFVAGKHEKEALEVMSMFSSALCGCDLRYLDLSHNALGDKGVQAFGVLLKTQQNLEELHLVNNGISQEAARSLCDLIPGTEKLKVLQLHNNMTGDEGAVHIAGLVARSPLLEDFRCSTTRVAEDGGIALANALASCVHLRKLDLRDNMFSPRVGDALGATMGLFSKLEVVGLSYTNLGDEGADAISRALKDTAPGLLVLDMAGNDITHRGAASLAGCLASKPLLERIDLSENRLGDEGAIVIAKMVESGGNQLYSLDLSSCAIRRAGARTLVTTAMEKPGFKVLNLSSNYVSGSGIDEIRSLLKGSTLSVSLEDIVSEEDLSDDEVDHDGDGDNGHKEDELGQKLAGIEIQDRK